MKFTGKADNRPVNKKLNFGGDPYQESGSVSRHWWDVPWRRYELSQCF